LFVIDLILEYSSNLDKMLSIIISVKHVILLF